MNKCVKNHHNYAVHMYFSVLFKGEVQSFSAHSKIERLNNYVHALVKKYFQEVLYTTETAMCILVSGIWLLVGHVMSLNLSHKEAVKKPLVLGLVTSQAQLEIKYQIYT